jgi:hypothetical protein
MRIVGVLALVTVLSACASSGGAGSEHACTLIAASTGISVRIAPPLAADVSAATLEACWDGECREEHLHLSPSTAAGETTCTGDGADDACSAQVIVNGGKQAFIDLPDLPTAPVRITLNLSDLGGDSILERTLDVTPRSTYPNGPDCGGGGTQARLAVDADGNVSDS